MFANLDIFTMSAAMASHSGRRQALTAQNMANVDTPGYRAQRMASFADITEQSGQFLDLRASRAGHLHGNGAGTFRISTSDVRNGPSPDGNTVTVEGEMLEAVSAKREHERALAIYKSALNVLHSTLSRR